MAKSKNRPSCLSAKNRSSFAYPTIKDRVPIIVCKVIDLLYRHRSVYPDTDSIKQAIELMSKLRYEIGTDKPFTEIEDGRADCSIWNAYRDQMSLTTDQGLRPPSWFQTSWLYAECYAYRRLWEAMGSATNPDYQSLDFFEIQKHESFTGSWPSILALILTLEKIHKSNPKDEGSMSKNFLNLLKISLWGNKCDLSISSGVATSFQGDPTNQVQALQSHLIVDHSQVVWDHLSAKRGGIVDIILDNVGFELLSDLVLADYLLSSGLAKKVRIRAKNQPWFVSDTMPHDITWTLNAMENGVPKTAQDEETTYEGRIKIICSTVQRWRHFIESGQWEVSQDPFWTYPHFYGEMKEQDPELYRTLSEAQLLIFKGDLNYRKLVGDLNWDPTTSFEESLLGFHPAPLVTLRTLKADVVTSLEAGQAEELTQKDPKWMINGSWAVIKFCPRIDLIQ